jgi:Na+-translocating ferredoxin:NAD+ oxidoreductase subunit D
MKNEPFPGRVRSIMWTVAVSLLPAGVAGTVIFGWDALRLILLAAGSAVVTEAACQLLLKRKVTVSDGSAVVTGILVAYILPARVPFWLPIAGSAFAIAIGKQAFGGMGKNIFNPALAGRAFLMSCWPACTAAFTRPLSFDAVTQATPLALLKEGRALHPVPYTDLFLGLRGGCIGEVCIAALLAGALLLLAKGYIGLRIPLSYCAAIGVVTYVFGPGGYFTGDWLFHLLAGGLILGAFFMATDYVTSPATNKGKIIFGAGCGVLTAVIRLWGNNPEGVTYAILIMNGLVPLITRRVL